MGTGGSSSVITTLSPAHSCCPKLISSCKSSRFTFLSLTSLYAGLLKAGCEGLLSGMLPQPISRPLSYTLGMVPSISENLRHPSE